MAAGPAVHPQQPIINAVTAAMNNNPPPPSITMAVAAHPWTAQERWDYSRTWQVQVAFNGANYNVRGHVHYRRARQHGANANGPFVNPAQ